MGMPGARLIVTLHCPASLCRQRQDSSPSLSEVNSKALTTHYRSNSDLSTAQSDAWLLHRKAWLFPTTYQPGGISTSGPDLWTPESRAKLWKGTASSEKATVLNPTDAFSHQPQNQPTKVLVDTCPAEQMGSSLSPKETFPRPSQKLPSESSTQT